MPEKTPFRKMAASSPPFNLQGEAGVRVCKGIGLSNLGNTCYLNSIIQCLHATPVMSAYFLSNRHVEHARGNALLVEAFAETVKELANKSFGSSTPLRLKNVLGRRSS